VTYIAIAFLLSDVTFFIFSLEKFIVDGYSFVNTLKRESRQSGLIKTGVIHEQSRFGY